MRSSGAIRWLSVALLLLSLAACSISPAAPLPAAPVAPPSALPLSPSPAATSPASACPVSEPAWAKPPEDPAVLSPPAFGYYYVNPDRSMWASAWWWEAEEYRLRASEEGVKVGWFRPAGAELKITGRRMDGPAPPLEAHASCCYPTRFQASGVYFPSEGCWEVSAKAAESELSFVVWVEP
jgi:hypothetical protein